MQIDSKYRVSSDKYNLILEVKRTSKKTNKEYYENLAYFSEFRSLLTHLVDLKVRATALNDLQTVTTKQEELYKLIESIKNMSVKDLVTKASE